MHVCEEFREKITERLLDRVDLDKNVDIQRELLVCNSCTDFYSESKEMIEAMSSVSFDIREEQWESMADRLAAKIHEDHASRQRPSWRSWFTPYVPAFAGAMALLLLTFGIYRVAVHTNPVQPTYAPLTALDSNPTLDPVTMEFLEQSELLLRNVMKLKSTSTDDVAEAKQTAERHLIALDQRKEAASGIQPVVNMMDKYETVLRDIHNLKERSAADDIADIKNRIERNGLIADMKAFQPKLPLIETDLGQEH